MSRSWREAAAPVIHKVLREAEAKGWDEKKIKLALRDAYPFGERRYYPYAVWLDEIRRQRGMKRSMPVRSKKAKQQRNDEGKQIRLALQDPRIESAARTLFAAIEGTDKPVLPEEVRQLQRAIEKAAR